jgi:hypothetical protein
MWRKRLWSLLQSFLDCDWLTSNSVWVMTAWFGKMTSRLCTGRSRQTVVMCLLDLEALFVRVFRTVTSTVPFFPQTIGCHWLVKLTNQLPTSSSLPCGHLEHTVQLECRHLHSLARTSFVMTLEIAQALTLEIAQALVWIFTPSFAGYIRTPVVPCDSFARQFDSSPKKMIKKLHLHMYVYM